MIKLAISGKANSGKNSVATLVAEHLLNLAPKQYKISAFANKIKETIAFLFPGVNPEYLYGASQLRGKRIKSDLDSIIHNLNTSVRQVALDLGKLGRNYDPYFWISFVALEYMSLPDLSLYCIADLRFVEEYDFLKQNGFIFCRVKRNDIDLINDISETEQDKLSDSMFDIIIDNNGTFEELKANVVNHFDTKISQYY